MSYTQTPNYSLYKPTINSDNDQWGTHLNANADTIDTQLKTIANTAGVISFNTRTGAVSLLNADVTTVLPPSSTTPVMNGTAAVGTGTTWARADHVHPTDTGIAAAAAAATAAQNTANAAQNNVGRNLLHNPLFNVAQRGAGPFTVVATYTLDRWLLSLSLDTVSIQPLALADGSRTQIGDEAAATCLQATVTGNAGASAFSCIIQRIEKLRRLSGKTVTVSFWAAASTALKLGASLNLAFGTGGSPSATIAGNGQFVQLATGFARYSLTFAVPSATGMTFGTNGDDYISLNLWFSGGTTNNVYTGSIGVQSGTFYVWGVQLEVGSVATPLEKPDPRYDLSNCQRFYQTGTFYISGSQGAAAGYAGYQVYPVTMRAAPSVTPTWTNTNITSPSIPAPSVSGFAFVGTVTAAGQTTLNATYTASADL